MRCLGNKILPRGGVLSPHSRSFVGKSFRQLQEAADGSALRLIPQLRMGDPSFVDEPSDLLGRDINVELLKRENRVVDWHFASSPRDPPKAGLGGKMTIDNSLGFQMAVSLAVALAVEVEVAVA